LIRRPFCSVLKSPDRKVVRVRVSAPAPMEAGTRDVEIDDSPFACPL
jgi:hypothetical protein